MKFNIIGYLLCILRYKAHIIRTHVIDFTQLDNFGYTIDMHNTTYWTTLSVLSQLSYLAPNNGEHSMVTLSMVWLIVPKPFIVEPLVAHSYFAWSKRSWSSISNPFSIKSKYRLFYKKNERLKTRIKACVNGFCNASDSSTSTPLLVLFLLKPQSATTYLWELIIQSISFRKTSDKRDSKRLSFAYWRCWSTNFC